MRGARCFGIVWCGVLLPGLLCVGARAAAGQAAVARVKTLLTAFGVKGPLRLQSYGANPAAKPPEMQAGLTVTDGEGHAYTAYFWSDRFSLQREHADAALSGWSPEPPPDRETLTRGRTWLAAVGTRETLGPPEAAGDGRGAVRLRYPILRNGHPFVSIPHYSYEFAFDRRTGAFLRCEASPNPPPVSSTPAKLDRAGALAALKTIWSSQAGPPVVHEGRLLKTWYTLQGAPELGYYLPKGRAQAILVWRILFMSYRDTGGAVQGGSSGMLIDAVTGRQVPTPTVP